MNKPISFGTSGWRSHREDFTEERLRAVSESLQNVISDLKNIVIGYDTREKSQWIAETLASYLETNACVVVTERPTPTPCVAWYCSNMDEIDLAIVATASHNPPKYNGVKIIQSNGLDASKDLTGKIEKVALESLSSEQSSEKNSDSVEYQNIIQHYQDHLIEEFKDRVSGDHRILYDSVNGTGADMFDNLVEELGYSIEARNNQHQFGLQGVEPNPSKINVDWMVEKINNDEADIGFVSDCDADRIKVVTQNGRVSGSNLLAIIYEYLSDIKSESNAVRTVGAGSLIDSVAETKSEDVFESPIGFKHTARLAQQKDAVIGGDQTDGYCYPDHLLNKDGIYTAMVVLDMIGSESITNRIDRVRDEYGERYASRSSVQCPNNLKDNVMKHIQENGIPRVGEPTETNQTDGIKFYYDDNWILVRPSGTEPKMRLYAESTSRSETSTLIRKSEKQVKEIINSATGS